MAQSQNPFDKFKKECEKFSAPFKLLLRLVGAYRKARPSQQTQANSDSRLKHLVKWEGFSFVFWSGVGFTMLQLPHHQYGKARMFFVFAALALVLNIVHSANMKALPRWMLVIVLSIAAGIVVNKINDWIAGMELEEITEQANAEIGAIAAKKRIPIPPVRPLRIVIPASVPSTGNLKKNTLKLASDIKEDLCKFGYPHGCPQGLAIEPWPPKDLRAWSHDRSNEFRFFLLPRVNKTVAQLSSFHIEDDDLNRLLEIINFETGLWSKERQVSGRTEDLQPYDINYRDIDRVSELLHSLGEDMKE